MWTILIQVVLIHVTGLLYEARNKKLLAHLAMVAQNLIHNTYSEEKKCNIESE